jgi:hypothetical protein
MKKLRIFDFDDTLALTDTPVRVMRGDKVVRNISSHEFKTYKLKDGERFDTGAFDKVLHPKVIKPTMMTIRKVLGKPSPAVVLTGRSKASPVKEWLASIGVDVEVYHFGYCPRETQMGSRCHPKGRMGLYRSIRGQQRESCCHRNLEERVS